MKFERKDMIKLLKDNTVNVVFTKVDGTERKMTCTLKEDLMPTGQRPKDPAVSPAKAENESVIRVFDTDILAWRSFRVDSVTAFTPKTV